MGVQTTTHTRRRCLAAAWQKKVCTFCNFMCPKFVLYSCGILYSRWTVLRDMSVLSEMACVGSASREPAMDSLAAPMLWMQLIWEKFALGAPLEALVRMERS